MKEENKAVSIPVIINEQSILNKIYIIRNQKVMLDFDLAEIYGYTTKSFNQQVKRNENRFPPDFHFQLTDDETDVLRSQFVTANVNTMSRTKPYVFTESGIYMLMTVLKGDIAIQQSIALIRTFRAMKDYIVENNGLLQQHDLLQFSLKISENERNVNTIQNQLNDQGKKLNNVLHQLNDTVRRSEISPILLDFSKPAEQKEYLILNGQPFTADEAYMSIYEMAEESIHIIDDYISIKTLHLLREVKSEIRITILSDNVGKHLKESDYRDFKTEYPDRNIAFLKTNNLVHDRYIILDYETEQERIFLCGSSSKDSGRKITTIMEMESEIGKNALNVVICRLMKHSILILKG